MMVNKQILNNNCVNSAEVHDKGPVHGRVSGNPEHCQTIIKQAGKHKHNYSDLVLGMLALCVAEQDK